jgi:hypothetical protein
VSRDRPQSLQHFSGERHGHAVTEPAAADRRLYSPALRTAVVLAGTAADGAYHAGVLRALQEAGVKIDLLAGHGIGAVGAIFGAIDGGSRLWEKGGLWRRPDVAGLYPWRTTLRVIGWCLFAGGLVLTVPIVVLAVGLLVYEAALLVEAAGPGTAGHLAGAYAALVEAAFQPQGLPTWLPRLALMVVAVIVLTILIAGTRALRMLPARRRQRGGLWWAVLGAPLSSRRAALFVQARLWDLIRGGARIRQPEPTDLGRRYAELLAENLDQPGFRELLLVVHDLDARRDLVFALLREEERRAFFLRKPVLGSDRRSAEAFDLAGIGRDHTMHVLAGALALPAVAEPCLLVFPPESYWRGEAHRLCDRPGTLARLLEEVAHAGARQVIVVTASAELSGAHGLSTRRAAPRARISEYLGSAQAAAVRDGVLSAVERFDAVFLVRPTHNPIGPLDLSGVYDERSDRRLPLQELLERGYEDAYRQFVEPVVGASGEALAVREGGGVRTAS